MFPSQGAKAIAFGSAISYVVLTLWTYVYLSRDLPQGFLARVLISVTFVVLTTFLCIPMPPGYRTILAIPMTLVAAYVTLFVLTPPEFRRKASRLASRLLELASYRFLRGLNKP